MSLAGGHLYAAEQCLQARVREAVGEARELLRDADLRAAAGDPGGSARDQVAEAIEALEGALAQARPGGRWRAEGQRHQEDLARLQGRYERRFAALSQVQLALEQLREITSPEAILDRAPALVCERSALERVILSVLDNGHLVARAAHFRDDPPAAARALAALGARPLRLEHPSIEVEVLRRRRATMVAAAGGGPSHTHRAILEALGADAYIVAPLLDGGEPFGALHAGAQGRGLPLDVLDADVVWGFARGLGELYETASRRRVLRRQRERLRAFLEWLGDRASELGDAEISLAAERTPAPKSPGGLDALAVTRAGSDDARVFAGLLTRRELEVLRLLVRGASNREIASELVISEATVKFHVANLLGKLRASSRAGAVARYHRLVGAAAARTSG